MTTRFRSQFHSPLLYCTVLYCNRAPIHHHNLINNHNHIHIHTHTHTYNKSRTPRKSTKHCPAQSYIPIAHFISPLSLPCPTYALFPMQTRSNTFSPLAASLPGHGYGYGSGYGYGYGHSHRHRFSSQPPLHFHPYQSHRRTSLTMRAQPASAAGTSAPISTPTPASSLRDQLTATLTTIRKIAQDHSLSNDSGVAFTSPRAATNESSSTASTITPEKIATLSQASTLSAGSSSFTSASTSSTDAPHPSAPALLVIPDFPKQPILASFSDASPTVVSSPTIIKANESFFSKSPNLLRAAVSSRSSLSVNEFEHQEAWNAVARELKPIADVLRTDRLRTTLGSTQLPTECLNALHTSLATLTDNHNTHTAHAIISAQIEILRVLANLCIDHQQNRDILHRLSAATAVIQLVSDLLAQHDARPLSLRHLSLLRTAMGAILNLQLEHIPTRTELLQAESLATLTTVASHHHIYLPNSWNQPQPQPQPHPHPDSADSTLLERVKLGSTVSSWAWRIVMEIREDEKEEKQQQHQQHPRRSSDDVSSEDDESEPSVTALLCRHSLPNLVRPLIHYTLPPATTSASDSHLDLDVEDLEQLVEADNEILTIVTELIESCAADRVEFRTDAVKSDPTLLGQRVPAGRFDSALQLIMDFVEHAQLPASCKMGGEQPTVADEELSVEAIKGFAKAKASLARAVVAIAGEDTNMSGLFGETDTPGLGGWFIERLKAWMRYDAKSRDDLVSCGMLAIGNLARTDSHCLALVNEHQLAPLLASLLSPQNDIKVSHGLVSLLKNLSIPVPNKTVIGSLHVIPKVTPLLAKDKDMVQPLQFATVGLLKHLCAGVPSNAAQLVAGGTLDALLELVGRIDDVPTKMEATRVIVNLVKALWSGREHDAMRTKVVRRDAIQALAEMVRSSPKYPILVNEGIFALTLVGSQAEGATLVATSLLLRLAPDTEGTDDAGPSQSLVQPARRSSAGSTAFNTLPPPPTALDMIVSVLARRDARMPPQFASNACTLVSSLCQAAPAAEPVQQVAAKTAAVLERLSEQGPEEALESAAAALNAARAVATPSCLLSP